MPDSRPLSPAARDAARLLGQQVRLGRRERRWTMRDLAERIGVSEVTLRKIERGDPTVALGTALEAAAIVGVALYDDDRAQVAAAADRVAGKLALLPSVVRRVADPDDDF